jgi:hypothetical protein
MLKAIKSLDAIPIPKSKWMVEAIVGPCFECIRSFADVLHGLAFAEDDSPSSSSSSSASSSAAKAPLSVARSAAPAAASSMSSLAMYEAGVSSPPPPSARDTKSELQEAVTVMSPYESSAGAGAGAGSGLIPSSVFAALTRIEDRRLLACLMNVIYTTETVIPHIWTRLKPVLPPNLLSQIEPHYNVCSERDVVCCVWLLTI